jgi:hypothetical protein
MLAPEANRSRKRQPAGQISLWSLSIRRGVTSHSSGQRHYSTPKRGIIPGPGFGFREDRHKPVTSSAKTCRSLTLWVSVLSKQLTGVCGTILATGCGGVSLTEFGRISRTMILVRRLLERTESAVQSSGHCIKHRCAS